MAEQIICTAYRTGVSGDTFRNAFTLTYFGPFVIIQCLSGKFTRDCRQELIAHFKTNPRLKRYWYIRRKRGVDIVINRPIN